jgi:uncharacterized membrane-anchored protein
VVTPGDSTLTVPKGYMYLDAPNTTKYLEITENLGDGSEVLIAPEDLSWAAYLSFLDEGYVKDDDKIDADALLKTLKDGAVASNAERRKRGWPELTVTGWAMAPTYNRETKRLEWATEIESEGQGATNFFTKILGRKGHTSIIMVASPEELVASETALNTVLGGYSFNRGSTYADFVPGDKVAEYGLAAMVAGGAAAVATKKGLWGVLAGFFAAAWKVVVAVALGVVAWVRSLFKKKE